MDSIRKIAIIGASGNFGKPITAALRAAAFDITIITRTDSNTEHPTGIPITRTDYTREPLVQAFQGHDAVVCVVGPGGIVHQTTFVDAAVAAGVKRFVIDDFGWGGTMNGLPEFDAIQAQRRVGWDRAKDQAAKNPNFTWTGISTGNPIDWAMKKFPLMGFDVANQTAIIYDDGTEKFTGTTLAGIGQSVVGVMRHSEETANRFVPVMSLITCQNDLLEAFEQVQGTKWKVTRNTTEALLESGRSKYKAGTPGWILDLVVAQLLQEGTARCKVAKSREDSLSELLGVTAETPVDIVKRILEAQEKGVSAIW